jgi:hypothetical protein
MNCNQKRKIIRVLLRISFLQMEGITLGASEELNKVTGRTSCMGSDRTGGWELTVEIYIIYFLLLIMIKKYVKKKERERCLLGI